MPTNNRTEKKNEQGRNGGSLEEEGGAAALAEKAKDMVKSRIGAQIERSTNDLSLLAKTLRLSSEQLNENIAAPYMGKVADRVEQFAHFIEGTGARDLLERVESLSRDKPGLFVGGALALGFASGRFLRSASVGAPEEQRTEKHS